MMANDMEEIVAALIGVVAKNQKFLAETQKSMNKLVSALEKQKAPVVKVEKLDLKPLEKALAKKQETKVTVVKSDPSAWDADVERDLSGFIRKVELTPKKKVVN